MELNWSTFVLEIINFLVLVWILKRFLYKPVLDMLARRQAGIDKTLADARALHDEAKKLQQQYEGRLADWREERQQARDQLTVEIEGERTRKLEELQASLEQERQRAKVVDERRLANARHEIVDAALSQGAQFAARLLQQAAGPEIESRLVELAIDELSKLPQEKIAALRGNYGQITGAITVTSVFDLSDDQQRRLHEALRRVVGEGYELRFEQDKDLLAGLRISIGAWQLAANLRDELRGFAELRGE